MTHDKEGVDVCIGVLNKMALLFEAYGKSEKEVINVLAGVFS